jgi:chemotaxis family two-component system response regulator Rcp1
MQTITGTYEMRTYMEINILIIEDNPGDILLTKESLKESKLLNNLHVVMNGEDAIKFLSKHDPYKEVPTPDLIFLDLNLPGSVKGSDILQFVKSSPELKAIPVVILTSSDAESDVVKSYNLHANCYVCKPLDFDRFMSVVHSITDFWFTIVKLPKR